MKRVFGFVAVAVMVMAAMPLFAPAAFADPHIKIEITSLYAGGNQMSVTMNIINDGDTDCSVTKINMQRIDIWDNTGSMDAHFTVENMSIYVMADHYVTKTYNVPLPNYVPHEFINPGFKFRYNVEWKVERGDEEEDDDDYEDGGDDEAF
ncbi:MAG: hypothetical protein IJU98_07485 [Synergistaceae bacterium]|nr:hypothetical protein [Synergistaceae bacterium]